MVDRYELVPEILFKQPPPIVELDELAPEIALD